MSERTDATLGMVEEATILRPGSDARGVDGKLLASDDVRTETLDLVSNEPRIN